MSSVLLENSVLNGLLSRLPAESVERLRPGLEPVGLEYRQSLYAANDRIGHVWFVESGLVSLITQMEDGGAVEVGLVGREGLAGLTALLGTAVATTGAIVQIPGRALRVEITLIRELMEEDAALRAAVSRYARRMFVQLSQLAACNRLHSVDERLARWLLMSRDRILSDDLALTQEFLSIMLGVRRAGVTVAVNALGRAGLVRNARRRICIVDPRGLEEIACECYGVIRQAFGDHE